MDNINLLNRIKTSVTSTEPDAKIILYGSYARGDYTENSDIDLLIIIPKDNLSKQDEQKIKYDLYDLEFETGIIISPLVFSKKKWNDRPFVTPFYENIQKEGRIL